MLKFLSLLLFASLSIFACEKVNIFDSIRTEPELDMSRFYINLALPEYNERLSKDLHTLNYEPYNTEVLLEALQILNKDHEKTQNEIQKLGVITTAKSALISGIDKLEPLFNALIWVDNDDEEIKLEARQLVKNMAFISSNSYNKLIIPSYRNLLLLDAINFFKYKEDRDLYISKLPIGKDEKDSPYKLIYMLRNDQFIVGHNVYPQDYEYLFRIIPNENVCDDNFELSRYTKNYKYSDTVISFFISKLFPKEERRLKNLSFLASKNSLIWEFLEYQYQIKNKNFDEATNAMKALVAAGDLKESAKNRNYLARKFSNVAYMASYNNFKTANWLKAWRFAAISVESSKNIKNLNENDIKVATHTKQILSESSTKMTEYLLSKNEHENADYVFTKTNDYIKILLERKF